MIIAFQIDQGEPEASFTVSNTSLFPLGSIARRYDIFEIFLLLTLVTTLSPIENSVDTALRHVDRTKEPEVIVERLVQVLDGELTNREVRIVEPEACQNLVRKTPELLPVFIPRYSSFPVRAARASANR